MHALGGMYSTAAKPGQHLSRFVLAGLRPRAGLRMGCAYLHVDVIAGAHKQGSLDVVLNECHGAMLWWPQWCFAKQAHM